MLGWQSEVSSAHAAAQLKKDHQRPPDQKELAEGGFIRLASILSSRWKD